MGQQHQFAHNNASHRLKVGDARGMRKGGGVRGASMRCRVAAVSSGGVRVETHAEHADRVEEHQDVRTQVQNGRLDGTDQLE